MSHPLPVPGVLPTVSPLTEAQEGGGIGVHHQPLTVLAVLVLWVGGQGPAAQEVCRGHVMGSFPWSLSTAVWLLPDPTPVSPACVQRGRGFGKAFLERYFITRLSLCTDKTYLMLIRDRQSYRTDRYLDT